MKMLIFNGIAENDGKPFRLSLDSASIVSIEENSNIGDAKTCILRGRKGERYCVRGDFASISEQVSPKKRRWSGIKDFLNTKLGTFTLTAIFITGGGALIKQAIEQYSERQQTIARERSLLVEYDSRVSQMSSVQSEISQAQAPFDKANVTLCLWWLVKGSTKGTCNAGTPLPPLVDIVNQLTNMNIGVDPAGVLRTINDMSSFIGAETVPTPQGARPKIYPPELLDQRLNSLRAYSKAAWKNVR
jgi:hypothetical protein